MPETNWPDWSGQDVAIVASGPSAKRVDIGLLKGRLPVLAIKRSVELAPWADVVYGCDYPWWQSVKGLPNFAGLKLSYEPRAVSEFDLGRVRLPTDHKQSDALLFDEVGLVGGGGNSGFQALNLAVQFGAARVLLIGFDCQGAHWYGRNTWDRSSNPSNDNFKRWIGAFVTASNQLQERGVEVVNASPLSALKCFRRLSVEDALKEWGL